MKKIFDLFLHLGDEEIFKNAPTPQTNSNVCLRYLYLNILNRCLIMSNSFSAYQYSPGTLTEQQAWEDNLSTLNAEDNSLWELRKRSGKKTSRFPPLMAPLILSYVLEDCGCYSDPKTSQTQRPSRKRENILIPSSTVPTSSLTSHQLLRVVEFVGRGNNKDECTAAVSSLIFKKPLIYHTQQTQKPRHTSRKYQRTSSSPGDLVLRVEDCLKLFQNGSGFLFKKETSP
ncbi:hypothetical protein TNCV_4402011 [Trichonephila clavipes]|nr:hypothetical protein TNCV_4402011 [Trichonephila clavipes]